jgi:hypothetical protein
MVSATLIGHFLNYAAHRRTPVETLEGFAAATSMRFLPLIERKYDAGEERCRRRTG